MKIEVDLPRASLSFGDLTREYGEERADRISSHLRRHKDEVGQVPDFHTTAELEAWWKANWPAPAGSPAKLTYDRMVIDVPVAASIES